ncbi:unnamed protein product [Calicophoron daubneyi]|uniref:FAD/NAD(P)-binding domain-containing protein n=1 Tax=Calicophoron daubneyi TaxID=300641 RepID=A0AAV2TVZ3_CALDB
MGGQGKAAGGGMGTGLLAAITVACLVGGTLGIRWYFNQIPDYDQMKKEARQHLKSTPGYADIAAVDDKSATRSTMVYTEKAADSKEFPPLNYVNSDKAGFPDRVTYLIVGAGTAGLAAARSIRASDSKSRVLMVAGGSGPGDSTEPGIPETDFTEPPPYLKPPLSKELWRRNKEREKRLLTPQGDIRHHSWLYYEADTFFLKPEELNTVEYGGVALLRGDPVVRLNPDEHIATLASGRTIIYDKCLLATGGKPKRFSQLEMCAQTNKNLVELGYVSYFRNLADYRKLRDVTDRLRKTGGKIAVIGGGFLGSELTVSLLTEPTSSKEKSDKDSGAKPTEAPGNPSKPRLSVTHVFRESAPLGHVLPPCLASATARFEAGRGAEVWPSCEVVNVSLVESGPEQASPPKKERTFSMKKREPPNEPEHRIRLRIRRNDSWSDKTEELVVDHVVCAIGIEANTDLAENADLEVDPNNGGFLVNAEMEARAGVYAAGDAASYWDPILSCRRRVEHLNFAEETGRLAGKNMAAPFVKPDLSDGTTDPVRSSTYHYQSSMWSTLGPNLTWDAIGDVNARRLLTHAFFSPEANEDASSSTVPNSELGRLGHGVVFYLTPKEKKLVGVLLWNLPEEIYHDEEYAAPSRLNIARSLLAERRRVGQRVPKDDSTATTDPVEAELQQLARRFDLYGELERDYAELKAYTEAKKLEMAAETTGEGKGETLTTSEAEKTDTNSETGGQAS